MPRLATLAVHALEGPFALAGSPGGDESLIFMPALSSDAHPNARASMGIPDGPIRCSAGIDSAGIEHSANLLEALLQALEPEG